MSPAEAEPYSIGAHKLPGLAKLAEECAEVGQVAGKMVGMGGDGEHWDGTNLRERMQDEIGDVLAAVDYFVRRNGYDAQAIDARRSRKRVIFEEWHAQARAPIEVAA